MKHNFSKKLASFLMSGVLLTSGALGWLPGQQTGLLDSVSMIASAEEYDGTWSDDIYYYYYKNVWFAFRINVNDTIKTAMISFPLTQANEELPADFWIPSHVEINKNGQNVVYDVTEIMCKGGRADAPWKVKRIFIPSTVTSLCQNAFYPYPNVNEVKFYDANTENVNNSACNIQFASPTSFVQSSPFIKNQLDTNGFAQIGNCLLIHSDNNSTTLDLRASKYNSIKYMARTSLGNLSNLKTLYLPKNLKKTGNYVCPSTLETVYYWDSATNNYRNLKTDITNNRQSASLKNIMFDCYSIITDTKLESQVADVLAKKALSKAAVTYRGNIYSGYNAWQQYQIVHKLFAYVGKNYWHYNSSSQKSPSYIYEMYQVENLGYNGTQTKGIQCNDYAYLFKKLCIAAGVEAERIVTISDDNHAYNVVRIGGKWFNLDSCPSWIGQPYTFMTTDQTLTSNLGNHRKKSGAPTCNCMMGDVNQDGVINVIDAQHILSAYSALSTGKQPDLTPLGQVLCDLDRDGSITVLDASLAFSYYSSSSSSENNYNSFENFYARKYGGYSFDQFLP